MGKLGGEKTAAGKWRRENGGRKDWQTDDYNYREECRRMRKYRHGCRRMTNREGNWRTGRNGRMDRKRAVSAAMIILAVSMASGMISGCRQTGDIPSGRTARAGTSEPLSRSAFLLNTFVTVTLYDGQAQDVLDGSLDLCRQYEELLSTTIETSDISRINHRAAGEDTVEVSARTAELIQMGLDYGERTKGAFDITIEPLSSLWDFSGGKEIVPEPEAIAEAVERVDYRNVQVEGNHVLLSSPDTAIDLGAIAKGYIADQMKEYLLENGVTSATINLGGNVLCVGSRPDGTPFKIGLQMPFADRNETIAALTIEDCSVVTSGVYERHFEVNGVNYHHLLNPADGYPYENGLLAVTIVSPQSVDGDALSTSCFSLGLEKGMELAESMDGVYGYFITEDYEIHYTSGAEALLAK